MRSFFFLALFLSFSLTFSQNVNIIWGDGTGEFGRPLFMTLQENSLYFGVQFQNKIIKLDLTNPSTPEATIVIDNLDLDPAAMALNGDYLYFSSVYGNTISKINITETNPQIEIVVSGLTRPNSLAFYNNDLYITHGPANYDFSGKISKINIDDPNPTVVDVLTGLMRPEQVIIENNYLFCAQYNNSTSGDGGKVFKLDLSDPSAIPIELISELTNVTSITIANNNLFIGSYLSDNLTPALMRLDLNSPNLDTTTIIESGINVTDLVNDGDHLYIAESQDSDILSLDLATTLGLNDINFNDSVVAFPNPSSDFIRISGLNETINYSIYNILGKRIKDGVINANQKINIQDFSKGLYFIKLDTGKTLKFTKN